MQRRARVPVLLTVLFTVGCGYPPRGDEADLPPVNQSVHNQLTPAERADGWELLFNGDDLEGWRGFREDQPPAGWRAVAGTLHYQPGVEGGDLLTERQFANFELRLEWRIGPAGNSGVMFRVTEEQDAPWKTATEMQVLDNAGHRDGANPVTSAGANYALYAPVRDATRPVGQWNAVRILANGPDVEFWLNDVKVVEFQVGSPDWNRRVAASKFIEHPGYGISPSGHIDLQDHGDPVWYRNLKIRELNGGQ